MVVSLSLPDELEKEIEKSVEMGKYASKSGLIRDAIRHRLEDIEVNQMKTRLRDRTEYTNEFDYKFQKYDDDTRSPRTYTFGEIEETKNFNYRLTLSGKRIELERFRNVLSHIQKEFTNSRTKPAFSIRQNEGMWYGIGLANLLTAIENKSRRYETYENEFRLDYYKKEYFSVMWRFSGSLFQLSGSIRKNSETLQLKRLDFSIATEGIPSNTQRYIDLAEKFDLGYSNINRRDETNILQYSPNTNSGEELQLEIDEGLQVNKPAGDMIAGGAIFHNPFYQNDELIQKKFGDDIKYQAKWPLQNLPYLFCYLNGSDRQREKRKYVLEKLTVSRTKLGDRDVRSYNIYAQARSHSPEKNSS